MIVVITPSIHPENALKLISNLIFLDVKFVFVVDSAKAFERLKVIYPSVQIDIIELHTKDFSEMRNIGYWSALDARFILWTSDDEEFDDELINSLKNLDGKYDGFSITVKSTFAGKEVRMFERQVIKVVKPSYYVFTGRVHEHLANPPINIHKLKGTIINHSYENWAAYWTKSLKCSLLDTKTLKRFYELTSFPLYCYLFRNGIRGGLRELQILMASLTYPLLICVRGTKVP